MAALNAWGTAALAMLPPLVVAWWCAARGAPGERAASLQLASLLTVLLLTLLTFAADQPALIDLPLALALLGMPGAVLFATFLERSL